MSSSAVVDAEYDKALTANAYPDPTALISKPLIAGPISAPSWTPRR